MLGIIFKGISEVYHLARAGRFNLVSRTGAFWFGSNSSSRRSKKRKKHSVKRSRSRSNRNPKNYKPYTAGKRPDTSKRRIRRASNGRYYVVEMKVINGKRRRWSRFISNKSAKASRKRNGGRY